MAQAHDITRLCIETRKDQIEALDWTIKPIDEKNPKNGAEDRALVVKTKSSPTGASPTTSTWAAFQGIHARRVLVVVDEACGVAPAIWNGAETLITNDESHILAIGNPDDPATYFAQICKPGSGWHLVKVSAFDSSNFTGEAIPETLRSDSLPP